MAPPSLLFMSVILPNIISVFSYVRKDMYSFSPSLYNYNIGGFYAVVSVMSYPDFPRICTDQETCKTFSYVQSSSACYLYDTWVCKDSYMEQTGRRYYKRAETNQSVPAVQACGNQKKDILFILDSTRSVNNVKFSHEKNFVNLTLSYFNLDVDKIQVAMMVYSSLPGSIYPLNTYNDVTSAQEAVLSAVRATTAGAPRDDLAFKYAFDTMFQTSNGDRADAENIIMFVTDDPLSDSYMTQVNRFGAETEFFVFGVGERPLRSQLEEIASAPVSEHVFEVESFNTLSTLASTAATLACKY